MKLLPKFALLSFGVSAIPLAIAGFNSARISERHLRRAMEEHEKMSARQVAEYVASHLEDVHRTLSVETRVLDLTRTTNPEVLRKFPQLVYHQSDDISAVAVLSSGGTPLAPPAYQEAPRPNTAFSNHEAISPDDITRFEGAVPVSEAISNGSAVGAVFLAGRRRTPHVVMAVKYQPQGQGGNDASPQVIAAMVSLRWVADYLANLPSTDGDIVVLDRDSRIIATARPMSGDPRASKTLPGVPAGSLPEREFVAEYVSGDLRVLGAYAPAPPFAMGVVVEKRLETALAQVRSLRLSTIYWMSVSGLVAAIVGAMLARSLSGRVGTLVQGARNIAQGKLDAQIDPRSNDELGNVARAFNAMATSLDTARSEIVRQTVEIKGWNETLEKRVEDKTRELREAQDLLLRSRSLAALGSLGAGVAHEINNPLTGVLGLAQLLLADLPESHPARPMVADIEEQALRIQTIVANLLRMSQRQAGEDFRPLDLARVIDDAVDLCGPTALAEAGIEIRKNVPAPSPPVRGSAVQLQAALIQLIQNARGAMENGGRLSFETSLPEAKLLRLRVSDTGRGIAPDVLPRIFDPFFTTKIRRSDTGIGLSVVHKIIEDHGGTIRVESQVGAGTSFFITFPVDTGASHLA